MVQVELIMPKMGESVMEATILNWLKKPGDQIEQDESVLEVSTDKVDTEIPSTHAGILKKILAKQGKVVKVGTPIAIIDVMANNITTLKKEKMPVATQHSTTSQVQTSTTLSPTKKENSPFRFYSPLVKTIAKEKGISLEELASISGTGSHGRLTKKDLMNYLNQGQMSKPMAVKMIQSSDDEIIQMDRMRKMIATRMVDSKRIAPHVTSFVEADVTNLVRWKNGLQSIKQQQGQRKITYTPIFVEAIVKAIRDFPMINIQVDGDRIIVKKNIHIGIAVALPSGNLIVPVLHHANRYNLWGIAHQVNELATRARNNELDADTLSGGTFTLSNVGSFGNVMGTPIIMQPQVGIIATGIIQKKPAVIETEQGDCIAIRHKMFLSHSYDHRVIDGALGGKFVRRVADYLEKFNEPSQPIES